MFTNKIVRNLIGGIFMVGSCYAAQAMQPITIEFPNGTTKMYQKFESPTQIKHFALESTISTEINKNQDSLTLEEAIQILLINTINQLTNSHCTHYHQIPAILKTTISPQQKTSLAPLLWVGFTQFAQKNPTTSVYFITLLQCLAPTDYDKAHLLIKSQTGPENVPESTAEWEIIASAIHMLKNEKNGQQHEAKQLLQQLKDVDDQGKKPYAPLLGNWRSE
jgi:hypothetical protein